MKIIYVNYANAFIVIVSAYLHGAVLLVHLQMANGYLSFSK